MTDAVELPPDPYAALGVPKDADDNVIKAAYRKLVLKWHPDKITDPAEKQKGADRFHLIQTSYERLTNPLARRRYDLEAKLAEAKKERASHRGGSETQVKSSYNSAQETSRSSYDHRTSERVVPIYEERRPAYAEFADVPSRTSRKETDYQRPSRRSYDTKEKVRVSAKEVEKEAERADRRGKARRATKDTRRDRDQKYSRPIVDGSSDGTDSDAYVAESRRTREEEREDRRRDERRRVKEVYPDYARRQAQEAEGNSYFDERSKKLFSQDEHARDYIVRASRGQHGSDRRASPSPQDPYENDYGPKGEPRPAYLSRNTSTSYRTSSRDKETLPRSMAHGRDRYSSSEEAARSRPAKLSQSRSTPAEIHIPADKPRAQSLQHNAMPFEAPSVKRADTMPLNGTRSHYDRNYRAADVREESATPGTSPEYDETPPTKYRYGTQYADDREYATTEGMRVSEPYHTEVREPRDARRRERDSVQPSVVRRTPRSDSPVKEIREPRNVREVRDRRPTTSKYAERPQPTPLNVRTTSYRYDERAGGVESVMNRQRPPVAREASQREPSTLYGEIRPDDRYQRSSRYEDLRGPAGYHLKRADTDRPHVSRNSSNAIYAR